MNDLRHAARFLWAHKSFTLTAVLTLAIGLGANTALFGLLSAALRPLHVPDADQIVTIAAETKGDESGGFQYAFSIEQTKDLQRHAASFSDVFGVMPRYGGLTTGSTTSQFFFAAVTDNYFSGLRITPAVGSLFTAPSGSPTAVVLGHSYWMRRFGGNPGVIGKSVTIDGSPAVITGVVPKTFTGTLLGVELDGYVTLDDLGVIDPTVKEWLYHNRRARPVQLFARLKPGVSVAEARLEMVSLTDAMAAEHPETDKGISARVIPEPLSRPLPMARVSEFIPMIQLFGLAVAMLVLLLACMNVANLLLVRASARQREMAVRAALGATPARLVRQMIAEGLLLSTIGGIAGVAVGQWVMRAYVARLDIGADLPFWLDVTFDWSVFLFSFVAAVLTGAVIGLWPAWRASRADARAALHDGGKSGSDGADRQRIRRLLVVGQIAGSLALLIVAGLFVRSLIAAERTDLGFDVDHIVSVRFDTRQAGYSPGRTQELFKELERRVSAWPDVASASYAFSMPMSYLVGGGSVYVEGQPLTAGEQPPAAFLNSVSHGYFETMQIPIVRGRSFTEDDEPATWRERRAVIINEAMAERFWPGQDPIGKRFQVYDRKYAPVEVVGVAANSKTVLVFEASRPFFYFPIGDDFMMRTLVVRAKGDPSALVSRLEAEAASVAPDVPIADLRTMRQSLSGIFGFLIFRVGAIQAGGMGLIGLVLAIVGVYGVVSFGASLRTREIGIRMALGAEPGDVLRLILGQGVLLVSIGVAIGLGAAFGLGRVLAKFLPLVNAADWRTFTVVALGLGALAIWACYLPARRATKVPAATALRHE
ncbi:MAG: ABC transporter permease [Acidobacteria bacterium]|nr:MAG: ABC transporter permease [Acidobacteriota bacterium]